MVSRRIHERARRIGLGSASGGVVVQLIESLGAIPAEVFLVVRGFFRVFIELPLEIAPPMLAAGAFDFALQLAELAFIGVVGHGECWFL